MIGGTEFSHGKLHILEDSAGIILLRNNALLIGNAILGSVNKIMSMAHYFYNREYSERYRKVSFKSIVIAEATVKSAYDTFWNVVCAAATATAAVILMFFNDLGRENDRIHNLNYRLGNIS